MELPTISVQIKRPDTLPSAGNNPVDKAVARFMDVMKNASPKDRVLMLRHLWDDPLADVLGDEQRFMKDHYVSKFDDERMSVLRTAHEGEQWRAQADFRKATRRGIAELLDGKSGEGYDNALKANLDAAPAKIAEAVHKWGTEAMKGFSPIIHTEATNVATGAPVGPELPVAELKDMQHTATRLADKLSTVNEQVAAVFFASELQDLSIPQPAGKDLDYWNNFIGNSGRFGHHSAAHRAEFLKTLRETLLAKLPESIASQYRRIVTLLAAEQRPAEIKTWALKNFNNENNRVHVVSQQQSQASSAGSPASPANASSEEVASQAWRDMLGLKPFVYKHRNSQLIAALQNLIVNHVRKTVAEVSSLLCHMSELTAHEPHGMVRHDVILGMQAIKEAYLELGNDKKRSSEKLKAEFFECARTIIASLLPAKTSDVYESIIDAYTPQDGQPLTKNEKWERDTSINNCLLGSTQDDTRIDASTVDSRLNANCVAHRIVASLECRHTMKAALYLFEAPTGPVDDIPFIGLYEKNLPHFADNRVHFIQALKREIASQLPATVDAKEYLAIVNSSESDDTKRTLVLELDLKQSIPAQYDQALRELFEPFALQLKVRASTKEILKAIRDIAFQYGNAPGGHGGTVRELYSKLQGPLVNLMTWCMGKFQYQQPILKRIAPDKLMPVEFFDQHQSDSLYNEFTNAFADALPVPLGTQYRKLRSDIRHLDTVEIADATEAWVKTALASIPEAAHSDDSDDDIQSLSSPPVKTPVKSAEKPPEKADTTTGAPAPIAASPVETSAPGVNASAEVRAKYLLGFLNTSSKAECTFALANAWVLFNMEGIKSLPKGHPFSKMLAEQKHAFAAEHGGSHEELTKAVQRALLPLILPQLKTEYEGILKGKGYSKMREDVRLMLLKIKR